MCMDVLWLSVLRYGKVETFFVNLAGSSLLKLYYSKKTSVCLLQNLLLTHDLFCF